MSDQYVPRPFTCHVEPDGAGTARIRPTGDLDMSTAPALHTHLAQARAAGFKRLVVDLSGLDFMDSTGLTLLTRWSLESADDGFKLALVPGEDRVQRLFELTGLATHFHFLAE